MPRDGSNIYAAPAGTTATAGTTIESAKYNAFVNDLVTDANTPRPIVAGGTGASTAGAALTALGAQASSAALTSIAALTTAANKGIYTTASNTYATFDLTAAGRALLDDADAATQRNTLGLGVLATQSGVTTALVDPATLVTSGETIASNNNDTTIPTSAAVKAYADSVSGLADGAVTDAKLNTGAATAAGTTWVGLRTAELAVGAVGSYAFLAQFAVNTAITAGTNYAGSGLRYGGVVGTGSGAASVIASGATPAGTWRAMGTSSAVSGQNSATLFLRIS